jgi:MFS family permease
MWTWLPAFLLASAAISGDVGAASAEAAAFAAIASGGLGCILGGVAADRIGRARVVNLAMAASGACCLLAGALFAGPFWLLALFACAWGFTVVADSAQFSALVTEVAPPHAVGTALTLQTSMGFLLTMVTIQLLPVLVDAIGWRWAFAALALGPALGIASIAALQRRARLEPQRTPSNARLRSRP